MFSSGSGDTRIWRRINNWSSGGRRRSGNCPSTLGVVESDIDLWVTVRTMKDIEVAEPSSIERVYGKGLDRLAEVGSRDWEENGDTTVLVIHARVMREEGAQKGV